MGSNSNMFCSTGGGADEGMVMYMDGFRFALSGNQPCLNFYFVGWTLNTTGKFVGAMIGVFLLALLVEGISKFRQQFVFRARSKAWSVRTVRSTVTLLHGFQALLGYVLMLATMTYSVELLLMTVCGLATGYAIFFKYEDDLDGTHVTTNPCCNFMLEEAKEASRPEASPAQEECCGAASNSTMLLDRGAVSP